VAHVVGVGVEFIDDGRYDDHIDRVVHALHLDEFHIDGIAVFELASHVVGEQYEFGVGQVVEINHLAVASQRFAHGFALFVIPLALLRAADQTCGEQGQQGDTEENFFHFLP